ncbi:MAG: hypothetical protein JXA13_15835 [Anaerolineales bacterium]|nr:hypothetical protein [Anaerolineales bacterium]
MEENIISNENHLESEEGRGAEQQSLNDATFEPRSYIEQTGAYETSEAVQKDLEIVIENTIEAQSEKGIPTANKNGINDGKPDTTIKDPLTGKGGEKQGNSSGNQSSDDSLMVLAEQCEPAAGEVSYSKSVGREPGKPGEVPASEIDGNEPTYKWSDTEGDPSQDISERDNQVNDKTEGVGPQRLGNDKLPNVMLFPQEGTGMKGPKSGGKKPGSGSSTSGGGPNVHGYGSGSKGNSSGYHDHTSTEGRYLFMQMVFDGTPGYVMEKDGNGVWAFEEDGFHYYEDFEIVTLAGQTLDGDTGMPYTGSSGGGEDPDPKKPIGGLDGDSGKINPVVGKGGGGNTGGSGTPGDKDGDDDSGKFLADGTMGGGGGGMVDPGDLDYYTPTELNEARKKIGNKGI